MRRFENAKAGDKVTCLRYGHGYIASMNNISPYPVHVLFGENEYQSYTLDGKYKETDFGALLHKGHLKRPEDRKPRTKKTNKND